MRVDLVCSESLERIHEIGQRLLVSEPKDRMDVVGHNHNTHPFETFFGFEPVEAFEYNLWDPCRRQDVCSVKGSYRNKIVGTRDRFSSFA